MVHRNKIRGRRSLWLQPVVGAGFGAAGCGALR